MRKFLIVLVCSLTLSSCFYPQNIVKSATTQSLIIKEIMPDPVGDDSLYEWLEIQNISTHTVQLGSYKINGAKLPNVTVLPQEIFILAKNTSYLYSRYPEVTNNAYVFSISMANSGGTLNLTDNVDNILHSFTYGQTQEGKTFELLEGTCNQIALNATASGNTIGKLNTQCGNITPTSSIAPSSSILLSKYSNLLEISQVRPCSNIESIILSSSDSYDIDLSKWSLLVDDERSMYLTDMAISSKSNIIITFPIKFIANTGGRISLVDPSGNQKDVFKYPKCSNSDDYFEIASGYSTASAVTTAPVRSSNTLKYPKFYDKTE